uniref:Uncharacterized protein n=1 Tax=Pararge aegeria TaxID=116150 RepID=S4NL01_9NEOP
MCPKTVKTPHAHLTSHPRSDAELTNFPIFPILWETLRTLEVQHLLSTAKWNEVTCSRNSTKVEYFLML